MRIGIDISVLNDKQRTGIAVYTYHLIEALLRINRGDKFILFGIATFATYDYLKNINFKNYPNVSLKIIKLPARLFRTSFLLWQKFNWPYIENFIGEVDILHSFNWNLPPIKNSKLVATVFDMTPLLQSQFHLEKTVQLDKIRLNRIKDRADLVITISQNSKKDFLQFSPKSKVEVVYPGVSENFKIPKDKVEIKKVLAKFNLKQGYFLSVGTLEPRKNIENLINAFLQSNLGEKLVLVGGYGWKNNQILNQVKKYPDKIIMLGYVSDEDLPILYNQALCLIYPSLYEGFGLPILEAQACGCPVITSNISSMPEVARKGAIFVDPYSVEDITRGIGEIRGTREKLIRKGFKNASRFSWEKSAEKLKSLYQRLKD